MALVVADRVQETTTTTGTGTYTLAGAKDGFQSFAAVGDGNTTYYACTDGTDYEVGIGTYTASGTTLARTTIIESSNSDAAVSWSAGDKDIFVTLPASKATVLDASGDLTLTGASYDVTWDKSLNTLKFADNAKAFFGLGSDLQIFHDGSNSYIQDQATGDLIIKARDLRLKNGNNEDYITCIGDGAVTLFHNDAAKLATTSTGVDVVSGDIRFGGSADEKVGVASSRTFLTGNLGSQLRAGNNTKVAATTSGVELTGATVQDGDFTFTGASYNVVWDKSDNALEFADNAKAIFGGDTDGAIYSDGNNFIIDGTTTGIYQTLIQGTKGVKLRNNGGSGGYADGLIVDGAAAASTRVRAQYGTTTRLETTSTGIDVTGNITVSGTVDGRDIATNIPSSLGTAGQVLTVNAGATAGEWASVPSASLAQEEFTATSGQTVFTVTDGISDADNVSVYINGVKLFSTDVTISASANTVTLGSGAATGDLVTVTEITGSSGGGGGGITTGKAIAMAIVFGG